MTDQKIINALTLIKNRLETDTELDMDILNINSLWADDIGHAIDALEKQEKNRWIPVEERLPEERLVRDIFNRPDGTISDSVFVAVESHECDGTHYYTVIDLMRNGKWFRGSFIGGSAIYSQKVIAWMPLPKPYKGEIK